jgi:lysophospholipase L1-like esterase
MDCLIVGDSIAKGVADVRKDCTAYVQSGITSRDWYRKFYNKPIGGRTVVISLGTNDTAHINTREELLVIRSMFDYADRVLWLLPPIKPHVQAAVFTVADAYGDDVLQINNLSSDGVHPTSKGYKEIAKQF